MRVGVHAVRGDIKGVAVCVVRIALMIVAPGATKHVGGLAKDGDAMAAKAAGVMRDRQSMEIRPEVDCSPRGWMLETDGYFVAEAVPGLP